MWTITTTTAQYLNPVPSAMGRSAWKNDVDDDDHECHCFCCWWQDSGEQQQKRSIQKKAKGADAEGKTNDFHLI